MKLTATGENPFRGGGYIIELLMIMKLTISLVLLASLQVSAGTARGQTLTLSLDHAQLEKAFELIESQSGYTFFYYAEQLKDTKPVSLHVTDQTLESVLVSLFKDQPIGFKIDQEKKMIIVEKGKISPIKAAKNAHGNGEGNINGKITNEEGEPLDGASVAIKGTKSGAQTSSKGLFELKNVSSDAILVITFIGYDRQEVKVNGGKELTITLKHSTNELDQTVIKGYYNTSERLSTGDVSTVKGVDISKQPVSDPILALEGRVPGLYISQTSGIPGAYATIQLRGQNSIANGNNPLYIVDGVPYSSSPLTSSFIGGGALGSPGNNNSNNTGVIYGASPFNNLNMADIESIEVLKDADATAIYGSRGANGVILITTKKGKGGATKLDVNVFTGAGSIASKMNLLNTPQYLEMRHEAFRNDNRTIGSTFYDVNGMWDSTRYTNWQKVFIGGTAKFTNAQVSLSGGNSNTQFLLSGGYSNQGTVFPGNYTDQKASVGFNLTHTSVNRKFHALLFIDYVNDNSDLPGYDFSQNITLAPDAPALYTPNGTINWQNYTWNNPIATLSEHAKANTDNLLGNFNVSYEVLPGLLAKSSFGYTNMQLNQTIITPGTYFSPAYGDDPNLRSNSYGTTNVKTWIIEPQLVYSKKIGLGKLDALAGTTFQENQQNSIGQNAYGFSNDALITNVAAASTIQIYGSSNTLYHYDAIFGRISYNWDDKYLINATARRDGSSRFGPDKQFGDFGAVGAAWIFSNTSFFKKAVPGISFGKIKISYGSTGNDQISDYQYLSTYSSNGYPYQNLTGLTPTGLTNTDYRWELVKKFETGIDVGLWKDRVLFNANYYMNRTSNQLVGYALPSITGFSTVEANLPAVIQNTGVEISINTVNFKGRDFTWKSSLNISIPRNKLISYPNLSGSPYSQTYEVGKPLYIQFLPHNTGVKPANGLYQFQSVVNHGGDTTTPADPGDFQFLKSITQKYYGGFLNSFSYKGFQLDIFFQFVNQTGNNYQQLFTNNLQPGVFDANVPTYFLGRWQQPNDMTNIQRFSTFRLKKPYDAGISNTSFIRLKNVSLSYNLPGKWQQKAHLQNARIYVQGQNLWTIKNSNLWDPEQSMASTLGLNLPPLRMLTVGLQVGL